MAKLDRPKIYFTGVGGQGTLTATKLLAHAAMDAGIETIAGEVHGMAQRGGVVESFLLLGGWKAPRLDLGEADLILGFEPLETLRALPYLQPGGFIFSGSDPLPPLSVSLGEQTYPELDGINSAAFQRDPGACFVPCRKLGLEAGAPASGNTALLGALCASEILPVNLEDLKVAIERHLPEKIRQINLRAMELGADYWRNACNV